MSLNLAGHFHISSYILEDACSNQNYVRMRIKKTLNVEGDKDHSKSAFTHTPTPITACVQTALQAQNLQASSQAQTATQAITPILLRRGTHFS